MIEDETNPALAGFVVSEIHGNTHAELLSNYWN
jgi:hypothetical protein